MKTSTRILTGAALLVAAFSPSFGQTAKTKPVGYRTETIKAGVFNLLSPNLDNAIAAAGTFETIAGTTLTDAEAAFAFTAGEPLTLKVTSGANAGVIADVASSTATTVTTTQDISSLLSAGVSYEIRKTPTVGGLFGATNSAGLLAGTSGTADLIWVPDGAGGYTQVYYSPSGLSGVGWRAVGAGSADQAALPVSIVDAIFIQRKGATDLSLVFTGHVQTTATKTAVVTAFNPVSRVTPVGLSLADSKLDTQLTQGTATTADIIWNPKGDGSYDQYFYSPGGLSGVGWRAVGGGATDQGTALLASGFLVQRKGGEANITINLPSGLDL